jgi:hypothetical protein
MINTMKILILILTIILGNNSMASVCLEVSDESLDEKSANHGLVIAEWSALVQNTCESPYDGTLSIRFLDSDGRVLHTATDVIILQANEEKESRRTITIPVKSISDIDQTDVKISERKRPL